MRFRELDSRVGVGFWGPMFWLLLLSSLGFGTVARYDSVIEVPPVVAS